MAADLIEALSTFLANDTAIVAAFPGGWFKGGAARDTPRPFGVFTKEDSTPLVTFRPGAWIEKIRIEFWAVAESGSAAEQLAITVRRRLLTYHDTIGNTTYVPTPLVFDDGREAGRVIVAGGATVLDPELGSLDADVWKTMIPIQFTVSRG